MGQKTRNLTPQQRKASRKAFEATKNLGSRFTKIIDPHEYTTPGEPVERVRHQQGSISKLARISRRIPRILSHNLHRLKKDGLSEGERVLCKVRIAGARRAKELLGIELAARNVFGRPYHDATAPNLRRRIGYVPPILQAA